MDVSKVKAPSQEPLIEAHNQPHNQPQPHRTIVGKGCICPVCSATFTRPQHVARHMRSHTGDKPYKCTSCGDQFTQSDLLENHWKKCSARKSPQAATASHRKGAASTSRVTTSKKACDQCVQSSLSCDGANPCATCIQLKCRCTFVIWSDHNTSLPSASASSPGNEGDGITGPHRLSTPADQLPLNTAPHGLEKPDTTTIPIDEKQTRPQGEEILRDDDAYISDAHRLYSGHCITANLAFTHASTKRVEVHDALLSCQYNGSYFIQAGFNTELMHIGQYEEEIYIFLEHNVSPEIYTALSTILAPFPGILYTPHLIQPLDSMTPSSEYKDLLYTIKLHSAGAWAVDPCKGAPPIGTGNTPSGDGGRSGENDSRRDKGKGVERSGGHGSPNGDPNGPPDGNGDPKPGGSQAGPRGPRQINIPFVSTLYTKESQDEPSIKFVIGSQVDIKIEENPQADPASTPQGSTWFGPWFSVDMKELNASTAGGSTQFILGLSQVIMTVLACPTMSIIKYSPITTHFEDDSVKTKAERTNLGGAWATVGMNPTLRVGGTSSSLSGNEQTQKRWQVTTHFLDSGGGIMSECKDGMLWKYAYNDKVFQPISAQDFHDASPTAVFGLSRASRLPQLEVDVVTHWTMSVVPLSRIFSLFRKGTKKTLPAYRNFFHHVSVGVDLGKVKHEKSWVVGAKTRDKQTSPDMMQFDPIAAMVESSESIDSACEITLRRAIYGRIEPLTTEDKTGAQPLLRPPEGGGSTSSFTGGLPTPTPSPTLSPSTSPQSSHIFLSPTFK